MDVSKQEQGSLESTEDIIRARAYRFYEDRDCEDGYDLEDWFRAEAKVFGKQPAVGEAADIVGSRAAAGRLQLKAPIAHFQRSTPVPSRSRRKPCRSQWMSNVQLVGLKSESRARRRLLARQCQSPIPIIREKELLSRSSTPMWM